MGKSTELVIGIILLVIGIWGIYFFSTYDSHGAVKLVTDMAGNDVVQISPVLVVIEGLWGIFVTAIGLVFFALGVSNLK